MRTLAHRLANFLEWSEVRGLEPLSLEYTDDLIRRYQQEMLTGLWSRDARPLSARTINARVESACEYLSWAADKGYRKEFSVSKTTRHVTGAVSPYSTTGHLSRQVAARNGKIREPKRRLGLPSEDEIKAWLKRVHEKYGPTKSLMCETVLQTALRREEVSCLRVDTLPQNRRDWKIANPSSPYEHQAVLMTIRYGTKGKEYGRDNGDKIGPEGVIRIPLELADRLHDYRSKIRPKAVAQLVKTGKSAKEQSSLRDGCIHLFLDESTGRRISAQGLYDAWRGVERPKGWSPHLGRDYWACSLLWIRIQQQRKLIEGALSKRAGSDVLFALQSNALSVIQLEIQPQLRHSSSSTTLIYLQWLADRLNVNLNYKHETDVYGDDEDLMQ